MFLKKLVCPLFNFFFFKVKNLMEYTNKSNVFCERSIFMLLLLEFIFSFSCSLVLHGPSLPKRFATPFFIHHLFIHPLFSDPPSPQRLSQQARIFIGVWLSIKTVEKLRQMKDCVYIHPVDLPSMVGPR